MKAVQVGFDEGLGEGLGEGLERRVLDRLDADPELKKVGRSEIMR